MNLRSFKRFFPGSAKPIRRPERPKRIAARLQLETLEDRTLMSTLPAPIVSDKLQLDFYGSPSSVYGPQIAQDPLNPNLLVELHGAYFHPNPPALQRDYGEMYGTFSFDGGATWSSFQSLNFAQIDPAEGIDPQGNIHTYNYITNVSISFDRVPADPVTGARNLYIVSTQHNAANTSGAIVFNKYTIDPVFGFTQDFSIGNDPDNSGDYVMYRWFNTDPAFNTYLAIDNNEPTFVDPVTGFVQTDSMATLLNDPVFGQVPKAVYVAWNTNQTFTNGATASNVFISGSADGGHNWSTQQYVTNDAPGGSVLASEPHIAFAQGTPIDPSVPGAVPIVAGGSMAIAYADRDPFLPAALQNGVYSDQSQPDGGDPTAYAVSAQEFIEFFPSNDQFGGPSVGDAFSGSPDIPFTTTFTIPVNFTAGGFTSLDDLDVEINLQTPHTSHLRMRLTAPTGQTFNLLSNRVDSAGNTLPGPPGLPDNVDLGIITDNQPAPFTQKRLGGTFFDLEAPRFITTPNVAAPYIGHYFPEGFGWASLYNRPITDLNGDWVLSITDVRNDGANPPPQFMHQWGLHFTSKISTTGFGADTRVATTVLPAIGDNYATNDPAGALAPFGTGGSVGIGPGVVVAYDNTLGSFSPHQGRLYMAYTAPGVNTYVVFNANTGLNQLFRDPADVQLSYSDDNGVSWSIPFLVNDDGADNFSEANRAQFMPALAVDQVTGAVVMSYFDGRMDAARIRVANSVTVSIDGGRSWSPSVFLNDIKSAGDFLTGQTVNIEPVPGNQGRNGVWGFGDRQGLVAWNGRAISVFGTNLDEVVVVNGVIVPPPSRIRTANISYAAGPRIVDGDMGPVTGDFSNTNNPSIFSYNNTFASDGTRQFDGFVVNFDRPIDPSTLDAGDIAIRYRDPISGAVTDLSSQIQSITPLDLSQQHGVFDQTSQPQVTMGDDALVIEGDSGVKQAVFRVEVSQPQLYDITIGYLTEDGTAVAGQDYVAKSGTVTIPAGQTEATFTVDVLGDTKIEGQEIFLVNMTTLSPGLRRFFAFAFGRILDNDSSRNIVIGEPVAAEGTGGTSIISFPIALSQPDPVNPVRVDFDTFDFPPFSTARPGLDYTPVSGTFTFAPGQTIGQIDVPLNPDNIVEPNEFFFLLLSNPNGAVLAQSFAGGYILEDDDAGTQPTVAISDAIVKEGDSDTTLATFTVVLSQKQPKDVTLGFATRDGTAAAGSDYVNQANVVVIPAEQASATFSIVVNGDTLKEGNETFFVELTSGPLNLVVVRDLGTATIVDDDGAPAVTVGDVIIREGDSGTKILSFPVSLSVASTDTVSIDYVTASGTALKNIDFVDTMGTFTFMPGQTTGQIDITIISDQTIEKGNEKFTLLLSNAKNASIARPVVTGTIADDDELALTIGDVFVQEGKDGQPNPPPVFANVTVYLNAVTSRDVTFTYQTSNLSATAGLDYTTTSGSGTIFAGQTSFIIPVPILYDTDAESLETFQIQLTSSTNAARLKDTAIVSVADNDQKPDVTIGDLTVREGDTGNSNASVPLYLSFPINAAVSVTYTVTSGPAIPPNLAAATLSNDYTVSGGVAVIPAGSAVGTIDIPIIGDTTPERAERFTVTITAVTGIAELSNKAVATVTILDNDVHVSIGDVTQFETNGNTSFVFTLFLSSPSSQTVSVLATTADGTANSGQDYAANNQTVTFTPGQTTQTFTVQVTGDATIEGNEDFFVNLSGVTGNATIDKGQGRGIIVDDDDGAGVFWTVGDAVQLEGASGIAQMAFTIFLNRALSSTSTIRYSTSSNPPGNPVATATAGQDYTGFANLTATLPANATTVTVIVDITGEQLQEGAEFFYVVLTNPSIGVIRRGTGRGTIMDDDQQMMVFGDASGFEGTAGFSFIAVPVMLSNAGPNNQPYDFTTTDGTAVDPLDYFGQSNTSLIFTPAVQRNEIIPILGDTVVEGNENFTLDLLTSLANLLVSKPRGNVTIVEDDDLLLSVSDITVVEGTGGSKNAVFTIYINAVAGQDIDVFYTTLVGTADAGDFTPDTNGFVTIPAGASSVDVTIALNTDSLDEGNETFSLQISSASAGGFAKDIGTCLIVDDDLTPALTVGPSFLREQTDPMTFSVFSSFPIAFPIDMTVSTSNGLATAGADYAALAAQQLTLPDDETSLTFQVNVLDDLLAEGNEDFNVTLAGATQGATFAAATDKGLIADNEPTFSLNIGDALVKESDSGNVQVTIPVILSGEVNQPITVHYRTLDGSATDPADYVDIVDNILTIPANTTQAFITVEVKGDGIREASEDFIVELFNASGATIAKPQGTVIIIDDDSAFGAQQFLVRITPQSSVGTYSYAIGPDVRSRIEWIDYRTAAQTGNPPQTMLGNLMDQNNNSITGENDSVNAFANDRFAVPRPTLQIPFQGPYASDTMPIIIPGPHLLSSGFKFTTFSAAPNVTIPAVGQGGTGDVFKDTGIGKLTVAGLTGQLADINVRVHIEYPNSGDLVLRLRAPNGQTVLLAQQRGSGNAYVDATFDDQAAVSVVNATPPFGVVRPEGLLGAFNYLEADVVNGEWSLEVEDRGGTLVGKLFDWSLTLTTTNVAAYNSADYAKSANEAVPDLSDPIGNPSGSLLSNLNVTGLTGYVTDVNVFVNLDYPFSGDLALSLRAPNGIVVPLSSPFGNGDGNFYQATFFDDQAAININVQDPNGPFYHLQPNSPLTILNGLKGEQVNGNWQLQIASATPFPIPVNPGGILKGWSLDVSTSTFTDQLVLNGSIAAYDIVFDRDVLASTLTAADVVRMVGPAGPIGPVTVTPNPPGTPALFANRTFRLSFPTQTLSGVYQITIGSDIQTPPGIGVKLDSNFNVGLDFLLGGSPSTGTFTATTYASNNGLPNTDPTPILVPAFGSVTADLQINDQFKIVQGSASDSTRHIQLALDIAHSTDPDLAAVLIAPDGTEIRLFSNVGVFSRVTFDDFAVTPVATGGSTFDLGTFNPQIPLSRLQGKFTSGLWKLVITNNGNVPATLKSWSLRFPYYNTGSGQNAGGLGEPVADQFTVGFRIFTMEASNPLSKAEWTAVGPAASNQHGSAGRVSAIAVDPSDPSGNTVYVGGAGGGVWKTTNFLTTSPLGPTYVPLTDLGPSNSLNIGSLSILGRSGDPRLSIVFAGTGEIDGNSPGVGLLRSPDGGVTWQVIDSIAQNFDAQGNVLPMNSSLRDHGFVGSRVNKIAIDPTPLDTAGNYAIYIAVSGGASPGLYRSRDTGKSWTLVRAGVATDVVLAPASVSSSGILQLLYAAFQNEGVFFTTSAPTTSSLSQMIGGVGKPNHRDLDNRILQVTAPASTPNGTGRGRILLATPHKTGDRLADTFYQNWLYVLVLDDANLNGYDLYLTKDRGDNWTRVVLPGSGNFAAGFTGGGLPTNDENAFAASTIPPPSTASELGVNPGSTAPFSPNAIVNGNDFEGGLTIDPSNPNVIYLAGTLTIKVDVSTMEDPWAGVIGDHSDNITGAATGVTIGPVAPFASMFDNGIPATPGVPDPRDDHFNLFRDPYNPFLTPSTFFYQAPRIPNPVARWVNDGTDVRWSYFTGINDVDGVSVNPPFRIHELLALRDPLTGKTRVILGNDQGVYTAVDALSADGLNPGDIINRGNSLVYRNTGSAESVRGSRNGNLQIAQFTSGAVQPSTLAADVVGALFYGTALSNGTPSSAADIVNTGNLNWQTYDQTRFNDLIGHSVDGNGTWIMTDATGGFDRIDPATGQVIFDPNRIGTTYQYVWPCCNNQVNLGGTDFFVLDLPNATPISRTTGLLQSAWPGASPGLFNNAVPRPFGRFAVNPLDPGAVVIGANDGRVFRTAGPLDGFGILWTIIAQPAALDGTPAQALAWGSPPTSVPNVNDFIYAGTDGGRVFVTTNGGGSWRNISTGLSGGSVLAILPDPHRGSNQVYAVTGQGVFWMQDSTVANPTWIKLNDTAGRDSLFNFTRPVFNNPADQQAIMLSGQITSLAVDWRYQIPDNLSNPTGPKHPVLYVAGNAGVFRSIDKGITWNLYPDLANNGAPQEGGWLPNVRVTDLDLMLGYLNPQTGVTNHAASQNLLLATTFGRGAFAIRLDDTGFSQFQVDVTKGPRVVKLEAISPIPGSTLTAIDVRFESLVDATTFSPTDVAVFAPNGQPIAVISVTEIDDSAGGLNAHNHFRITIPAQTAGGNYRVRITPTLSDFGGNLLNQDNDNINGEPVQDIFDSLLLFLPNTAPTISDIPNQSGPPNTTLNVPFTIGDGQTPNQLTLSASVVIPPGSNAQISNLNFNGNPNPSLAVSTNPTISFTTGALIGSAIITVTVTDPFGLIASDSFTVFVNNPPTLLPNPIPSVTDLHPNFPKLNYVDLDGTDPDGDVVTFGANAYTSASFTTELVGYVAVNATTGQLDLTPSPAFVGTFFVRAFSTDGMAKTFGVFSVTVTDNPPTLAPIGDIVDHRRNFPKDVALPAADPDPGEVLTSNAVAYDYLTYRVHKLDESLGLFRYKKNYDFNKRGKKEKYLKGFGNVRYFLLPNGQFFRFVGKWTSTKLRGILLDTLPTIYYKNPLLLANSAPATVLAGFVSTTSTVAHITPSAGFLGTYVIEVSVSDGAFTSPTQAFKITVYNNPPVFTSLIGSVVAPRDQFPQVRQLTGADADGIDAPFLTFSAQAYEKFSYLARQLDNQYGFFSNGNFMFNKYKKKEKHFKGAGNKNFYILPDGRVFRRTTLPTSTILKGKLVGTLTPTYWADPFLLVNSPNPTVLNGFVSVAGSQISFTPSAGFVGEYYVDAFFSDGQLSAVQSILVNVQ